MIRISRFLIADGHSIAYRAFHAVPQHLAAPDGTPTAVIMAFMNMLYKVQDELFPDYVVVVFDAKGKTFRHEIFADYKSTRPPTADPLRIQLPILQELLRLCGYSVVIREGVEADDTVASIAKLAREKGHNVTVLSSDKDLLQILGTGIDMMRPVKNGVSGAEIYTVKSFMAEYGFHPASMPDYLAITGDNADNIKGVHGIGEKGAKKILAQYPTLEAVYANLDSFPKSTREKLEAAGRDSVIWKRDNLFILRDNIFDGDTDFLIWCMKNETDFNGAESLALRLGLTRVLERIGSRKSPLPREIFTHTEPQFPENIIITHDYKAELRNYPAKFADNPPIFDIKTAHYLLHPDSSSVNFSGISSAIDSSENPGKTLRDMAGGFDSEIRKYPGLHDVMTELDIPLIPVLINMENRGIRIDPEKFSSLHSEFEGKISELENHIMASTGFRINLNSPAQISWLLFEKLGFTPSTKTKSKTSYSTGAGVLEKLAALPGGEIPALILEHRETSKMLTGFVVPFLKAADKNGIIRTTFEPSFTGTGRLSSRDPNLQNIPVFGQWADKIKAGIIPADPENVFVSADYSQIELRILAHMSGEKRLIDSFAEGRDIHTETASWVFGVIPEFVTHDMRRAAKMINFGLLYGMTSFGLSERLNVTRKEAEDIMKRYFGALPGLKGFIDGLVHDAKERGYTRTLAGRIRPVNEIPVKGLALNRALINSPIQGTAADTARRAMINFASSGTAELILQVHDSLVCECPPDKAEEVSHSLREIMIKSGGELSHLEAETKTGRTLADV